MKLRTILFSLLAVAVIASVVWFFSNEKGAAQSEILVSPKRGDFIVTVTTTGELEAINSIQITGPSDAQAASIWQMKISNLVSEGTVVKKGEFVAELDKSEIDNKVKESALSVQKLQAQYTQTMLDSALTLAEARDDLTNLRFAEEEKRILWEGSAFEAPAMKRQAEIDYERAKRNVTQAKVNYVTKRRQSIAKMEAVSVDLQKEQQHLAIFQKVSTEFTINAPADGMVIFAREWNGKKRVVGSQVSPWDPAVATLPDLRSMESVTYVNEIDIQKIAVGQTTTIRLDADPKKVFTGVVTGVANIGEQRPNSDSKVFEVKIKINEADTTLRPAMTTANEILVARKKSVLSIPLECVRTEGTTTFAFKKDNGGVVKQQVKLGLMNDNDAEVLEGVAESDQLYLSNPSESAEAKTVLLTVTAKPSSANAVALKK